MRQNTAQAESIHSVDSDPGEVHDSIRRLAQLATSAPGRHNQRLLDRLREPAQRIEAVYGRLAGAPPELIETSRAAEWLLDNHHIVRRALRLLREEFPRDFERRLPCLTEGECGGQARVYALAMEIVAAGRGPIDLEAAIQLLRDFQSRQPLTVAEAWALPAVLRLVVLERLATAADSVAPAPTSAEAGAATLRRIRQTDELVATCVRSLRVLETADWKGFVESISAIERILRDEPASVYARMDFDTRDRYRKAVEELAFNSPHSETDVAVAAVRTARDGRDGPSAHVGYHLIGPGRSRFERELGYRPPWRLRLRGMLAQHPTATYLGSILVLTIFFEAAFARALGSAGASSAVMIVALLLACVPASTIAVSLVHGLVTRLLPPSVLPKMDFERGIPPDCHTLVAVPALLTHAEEIESLAHELEIRFLANQDPHLHFALLTDFGDASAACLPNDAELLRTAEERIRALNARHGTAAYQPFHLLHRPRVWSATEGCWMGSERKRGKLSDLNRLVSGETPTAFSLHVGDAAALATVRFVITLDADTELPRGSAARLVATLAHPLNRAQFDAGTGTVVHGYTVLQPRIEISPLSTGSSWFSKLFAPGDGLDPYTRAVSDVYQDVFGEGVYTGKGIYDVAAFERSLAGRVPPAALLSHDLFEGVHGRAGLVTDVVLVEDYPSHYLAYARRLHRWARGDWQLVPWLRRRVPDARGQRINTRLTLIARWKILDNLRRSLLPPSLCALLIAVWTVFPDPPWLWTLLVLLVPATPGLTDLIGRLASTAWPNRLAPDIAGLGRAFRTAAGFWFFEIAFLVHQATLLCDAIGRTLFRLCVTRRHLLEWTTAAHVGRGLIGTQSPRWLVWREMAAAPLAALVIAGLLAMIHPAALSAAGPLLALWLVSPEIAARISQTRSQPTPVLTPTEVRHLRTLGRRTWAFFETFVGPEDQWLPPDHFQEDPRGVVARRTSPTNIGLLLLATTSAYDFGYRGVLWVALRLKNTFDTLDRMERYRGHFLNWYDTATLEPLLPRYVSTVDSGNLAGCLLAVKEACREFPNRPVMSGAAWQGFLDTLDVLDGVVDRVSEQPSGSSRVAVKEHIADIHHRVESWMQQPEAWAAGIAWLTAQACPALDGVIAGIIESDVHALSPEVLAELRFWSGELHRDVERMQREMQLFLPWLIASAELPALLESATLPLRVATAWEAARSSAHSIPSLADLPSVYAAAVADLLQLDAALADEPNDGAVAQARTWIDVVTEGLRTAQQTAEYALGRLDDLRQRADRIIRQTEFALLYDQRRRLFRIGYNVTAARLDDNHYDLLASEARLTSFVAIAKGDVPEAHWLHLGRPVGNVDGVRALLSWSGTMFEYLMPALLLRETRDTLIGHSCAAAVAEQIAYAQARGVPWGISESGYYRLDAPQNYQYRAFGVPALGFKRGLGDELVISPYASLLALPFEPRRVLANLGELQRFDMCGRYGLYEAIDFTWSRLAPGQRYGVVRSFMAHHQGMILAALNNFLHDGVLVSRFHADPTARTAELLLYEQPARRPPIEQTRPPTALRQTAVRRRPSMNPWPAMREAPVPQTHVLSNGSYTLVATDSGGAMSRWRKLALTRWAADPTLDDGGFRIYLHDKNAGGVRALFREPAGGETGCSAVFHPHMVELQARYGDIVARESITVAPHADAEIRMLTLSNESNRRQRFVVTSYGEVVLNDAVADHSHPAFSKLFVESKYLPNRHALLFQRRRRAPRDEPAVLVHAMVLPNSGATTAGYESCRERFLGRGGTLAAPAALSAFPPQLSGTTGATLDPVMALSAELDLPPHRSRQVAFVTLVAESRDAALALADAYKSLAELEWVFEQARNRCEAELARLKLEPHELPAIERMLSLLLYPHAALRATADVLERNTVGRSALWRFAISGDLPLLLVRIYDLDNVTVVHELLRAQAFWRGRGIAVDLVILNEHSTGYSADVDDRILRTIAGAGAESWVNRSGGVFLIQAGQLAEADRPVLMAAARMVFDGAAGGLAEQVKWPIEPAPLPPLMPTLIAEPEPHSPATRGGLLIDNELGGFSPDGKEYVIQLESGEVTPAPWVNVIANPGFGFVVSEAGGGYTWAGNSAENRLTPWSNDPVAEPPGEVLYLRDEETAEIWSATPMPARAQGAYQIRHGAGYTIFHHAGHELEQELRLFVPLADPVKIAQLTLTNRSSRPRRITATYYVEWVLGTTRAVHQPFVVPAFDTASEALVARNPWNEDWGDAVAFLAGSHKLHGFTTDRTEFFGRQGHRARPAALTRIGLSNAVRAGLDPCAAAQLHIDLAPAETKTVHFLLGEGETHDVALSLVRTYRSPAAVATAWAEVTSYWDRVLGAATAHTPDPAFNVMANRWLLYQTVASRVWARTGFYQSSGAFGFRDQLQDVAALVHAAPDIGRAHLLECARHQFEQGDVLHWWHPPSGAGIRTRCSDDLLWLPYMTAHYIAATGDHSVLSEAVPFLRAEPLRPEESDRCGGFPHTEQSETLYHHCLRAIEKGYTAGPHGVPLFGSGDWNDAMNRVGVQGRGESVWLGWLLYATLQGFAPLCRLMGDNDEAGHLLRQAADVRAALEASAWDGAWYRRGWYDDGSALGSSTQNECAIDSIAQSWAVLSGGASRERAREAMRAARERLVRSAEGLVLLLTPPFNSSTEDPGYIAAYPPGVRENGGQYTHAAVWLVWALVDIGEVEAAVDLFNALLPTGRSRTHAAASCYRVEPYVLAADIYSVAPHTGRGGWTWYTGSAGWAYRFAWEKVLGLRQENGGWHIDPNIPRSWPSFDVTLRDARGVYQIRVENPRHVNHGVKRMLLNGAVLETHVLPPLRDGDLHEVVVILG